MDWLMRWDHLTRRSLLTCLLSSITQSGSACFVGLLVLRAPQIRWRSALITEAMHQSRSKWEEDHQLKEELWTCWLFRYFLRVFLEHPWRLRLHLHSHWRRASSWTGAWRGHRLRTMRIVWLDWMIRSCYLEYGPLNWRREQDYFLQHWS